MLRHVGWTVFVLGLPLLGACLLDPVCEHTWTRTPPRPFQHAWTSRPCSPSTAGPDFARRTRDNVLLTVSFLEWLRTGRFGPIHLGMSRTEVEGALGPPPVTGGTSRRRRTPTLWKYGDVELHFGQTREDPLDMLFLEGFSVPSGGQTLTLDPWTLRGGMGLEEAIRQLQATALSFEQRTNPADRDYLEVCLASGVKLGFGVGGEAPRGLITMTGERPRP